MGKNNNREEELKNLFNKSINDIVQLPVGDNKDQIGICVIPVVAANS